MKLVAVLGLTIAFMKDLLTNLHHQLSPLFDLLDAQHHEAGCDRSVVVKFPVDTAQQLVCGMPSLQRVRVKTVSVRCLNFVS